MSNMTLSLSSRSLRNAARGIRAFICILGILAVMLLGANVCRAAAGAVLDNGGFFSEQAKSDASKVIGEMGRTMHEDLVVETFKEIPADVKGSVNLQDKAAVSHLFEQWASKQFKQERVNGVYVLIVKEPAHLQVNVGNNTQRQAFTLTDRDALSSLMRAKLHAHQNDEALRDGANFVFATMKSHSNLRAHTGSAPAVVPSNPVQQSGGSGGWLIPAIVIGVVVWLVIGLFRALSGRMSGGSAMGQAPGGGGGGGFLSSLVGGMFGAAAGMWMYDQFFSNHGNSAFGSDRNDQSGGDSGFSGQDTDSSSSGGDFGSDSDSGSDSGGDFGGGDSGGGDSGGGGDF
jgi:uncharacterized protein